MASLTYEENRIAKYKQLLRQAFADGLLSHNQIERLEASGFDFTPSKGSLIEIVPDITCAFCPETGEVFVSLRGAARMLVETGMSTAPIENTRRHLYGCMKSGKSFAYGCHWEYVDVTDKSQNGGLL